MRRRIWLAIWVGLATGCPESSTTDAEGDAAAAAASGQPAAKETPSPSEDPLLARARASIRDGRVPSDVAAELRASKDPAHARAARLLTSFDAEIPEAARRARQADDDAPVADPSLPPVRVPEADGDDDSDDGGGDAVAPTPAPPTPAPPVQSPSPPKPSKPTVSSLAMSKTSGGATLTIKADGGVTVGVANQLASGIVHLVIEGATASPTIASSRPSVAGAKVTRVRKGQGTVQITLDLEPGWTLGKVSKFDGGAKVRLVGPK